MIRSTLKAGLKKVLGMPAPEAPAPPPPAPAWRATESPRPAPRAASVEAPPVQVAPLDDSRVEAAVAEPTPAVEVDAPPPAAVAAPAPSDEVGPALTLEAIQEVMDEMVRPALQGDGGDITLIKVENNDIYVKLVGSCSTCPSSIMTMKMGVEALLKEEFPQMGQLISVT